MTVKNNFITTHLLELKIRKQSIAYIESDLDLSNHLDAIHDSMDFLHFVFCNYHHESSSELTLMRLGIRNFNSISASIKLGLSGYYQSAISMIREILETMLLMDYFSSFPNDVDVWVNAEKKERSDKFRPLIIRQKLDKRDGFKEEKRHKIYRRLSDYGSHPTPEGFKMFSPNWMSNYGAFFDKAYLKAWLEELAQFVPHGSIIFSKLFDFQNKNFIAAKLDFVEKISPWVEKYFKPDA